MLSSIQDPKKPISYLNTKLIYHPLFSLGILKDPTLSLSEKFWTFLQSLLKVLATLIHHSILLLLLLLLKIVDHTGTPTSAFIQTFSLPKSTFSHYQSINSQSPSGSIGFYAPLTSFFIFPTWVFILRIIQSISPWVPQQTETTLFSQTANRWTNLHLLL